MKLSQGRAELIKKVGGLFFRGSFFYEQIRESLIHGAFHNDVEVHKVFKVPIHFNNIGMTEEALYLDFPSKLFNHVLFLDILLGQNFNGADKASLLLAGQNDSTVSSFA